MMHSIKPEDLLVEEWRSPEGSLSLRVTHLPTGLRCSATGEAGRSREELLDELVAEIEKAVAESS